MNGVCPISKLRLVSKPNKPHIYKFNGRWWCDSGKAYDFGKTPLEAFQNWAIRQIRLKD